MKSFFAFAASLAAFANAGAADMPTIDVADFELKTFDNMVDHFNFQDDRTYSQRYWVNDKYFTDPSGPNLIYLCGEYTCSIREDRLYPFMVGAAHGARLLVLEHRFYGDSQPFDNWSLESLQFLSSEQAMADIAFFLGSMNEDLEQRQTIVVGGSYPGALSAWFRAKYPHMAIASWASSAVVQPIVDFWQYDEQIYTSTLQSGSWCPEAIALTNAFVTEQAALRLNGMDNWISEVLRGTAGEDMRTDDFMSFYADIPAGSVQYGQRVQMCDTMKPYIGQPEEVIFKEVVAAQVAAGNPPSGYATGPGTQINSEVIDVNSAGRQWTYQVCTEFGWFQTPSQIHPMRSALVNTQYWIEYCKRVFVGMDMTGKPDAWQSTTDQGGFNIAGTNTMFLNGGQDPWQWATVRESRPELNQVARTSWCPECGHCCEMYTPKSTDAPELVETRDLVADWVAAMLESYHPPSPYEQPTPVMFLN